MHQGPLCGPWCILVKQYHANPFLLSCQDCTSGKSRPNFVTQGSLHIKVILRYVTLLYYLYCLMCRAALFICLLLLAYRSGGQELFPMTEPASNVPKGALGVRLFAESFNEVNRVRNLFALKVMYGLTPRLTVIASPNVSNHHSKELPPDFPVHNTPQIGVDLPYLFNGVNLFAKYRFLSKDGANNHLRMAVYGEYGLLNVAHDEAEPGLFDDNSGLGAGLIATYLRRHFAVSFTGGYIHSFRYKGVVPDVIPSLPGVPATVTYGAGYNYSLSFGYLVAPRVYKGYEQTNWNVYLEFLGKAYDKVNMQVGNIYYNSPQYTISTRDNRALQGSNYLEVYPGIQCIIRSTLRIDLSVGIPLINRSYVHYYPVYNLGVQRYFYFRKHSLKGSSRNGR